MVGSVDYRLASLVPDERDPEIGRDVRGDVIGQERRHDPKFVGHMRGDVDAGRVR
jgi:hypothetical protein